MEATEKELWYEQEIAKIIRRRIVLPLRQYRQGTPSVEWLISKYESDNKITLDEKQKEAVVGMCNSKVAVLTGGPGTGKTSVLKCLVFVKRELERLGTAYPDQRLCCRLLAPTGKAARRMTEATGREALTVLRAINYNPAKETAKSLTGRNVFVDESSMLDAQTCYLLLKEIQDNETNVYFIGDVEQLPSVGYGCILRDLIQSGVCPVFALTKTFRQKEGSTLLKNIQIVRDGYEKRFIDGTDFISFETLENFLPMYYSEVKKWGRDNVVILTPTRKAGKYCSENLNRVIQKQLNKNPGVNARINRDERDLIIPFRIGDPVMQLVNREVANGDVGKVVGINPVKVQFSDREITYRADELYQLDLAYAVSIHKSQGSEYPCVFVLCTDEGNLDRNMIYTAITRAKKQCYVFGSQKTIKEACKVQTSMERITQLQTYLKTSSV